MDNTVLLDRERIEHLPHKYLAWVRSSEGAHSLIGINLSVDAIDHVSRPRSRPTVADIVDFERDIVVRSTSKSATPLFLADHDSLQIPREPDRRVEAKAELSKDLVPGQEDLTDEDRIPVSRIVMR